MNRDVSERHAASGLPDEQRRRIRRNAILLAGVAIAIYVTFIASGVLGRYG